MIRDFLKSIWVYLKQLFQSFRKNKPLKDNKNQEPEQVDYAPGPVSHVIRQNEEHPCASYMQLKYIFRDIGRLKAIAETMGRDFLTAMPEGAWKPRLGQISYLHRRIHEDLTGQNVESLLEKSLSHQSNNKHDWDDWDSANLREMQSMYQSHKAINPDIIEKQARLSFEGRRVHRDALANGDWPSARAFLSDIVDLNRHIAETKCRASGKNSYYQVLMDEYMPGVSVSDVEDWFKVIEKKVGKLIPEIISRQENEEPPVDISDFYPAKAQMWLNRALLESIGFDFHRGGIFETGHNPVEGGTPDDTRLVIKNVDTTNFMDSMKSALHEGGHGIYIQGLPRRTWRYQPVGQDMGAAVHESQALLVEMLIGRTREFFQFLAPRVEGLFHGLHNPVLSAENLYKIKTRVSLSPIRKKADEVTYFLHMKHRFELERDLIEGRLKPSEVPDAWNAAMKQLTGHEPEDYRQGCLQDVHWFVGKFGYFPSYTIGHMLAAQLYQTLKKEIPDLSELIAKGEFLPVSSWLRKNIYSKGRLMDMDTLITKATGAPISPHFLFTHLEQRYLNS
jgi:carboxypeptidase Taq